VETTKKAPTPHDGQRGLKPPQFRLRTMLLAVALLSVLLALMTSVGPLAAFGLLLLTLSIIAHVAGNAIGTRLRENGSRPLEAEPVPSESRRAKTKVPLPRGDFAPATRLSAQHPLGWIVLAAFATGVIVGGSAGGGFLAWLCWERITPVSVACGAAASGALGGFAGFLISSFARELLRAHADAVRFGGTGAGHHHS
jgi:fatty acid desaturase